MNKKGLYLLIAVALLFAMGLLMVFNTTAAEILDRSLEKKTSIMLSSDRYCMPLWE